MQVFRGYEYSKLEKNRFLVKRGGSIGKVESCQVGVYAAYASRHGYSFLDNRLFISEKCFSDDYRIPLVAYRDYYRCGTKN